MTAAIAVRSVFTGSLAWFFGRRVNAVNANLLPLFRGAGRPGRGLLGRRFRYPASASGNGPSDRSALEVRPAFFGKGGARLDQVGLGAVLVQSRGELLL